MAVKTVESTSPSSSVVNDWEILAQTGLTYLDLTVRVVLLVSYRGPMVLMR